jgi:hypothetical protein
MGHKEGIIEMEKSELCTLNNHDVQHIFRIFKKLMIKRNVKFSLSPYKYLRFPNEKGRIFFELCVLFC